MKNYMNYLIALLAGLLVLTLTTQPSMGAGKTYDAEKLAEYSACLNAQIYFEVIMLEINGGNGSLIPGNNIKACNRFKP